MTAESYRLIPLTKGQFAKVSPEDYDHLSQIKWNAAWWKNVGSYYALCKQKNEAGVSRPVSMHRLLLGLKEGNPLQGDHINHDTLDNRRENLRAATRSENQQNKGKTRRNKTGLKGVNLHKRSGLFRASITVNSKSCHLGYRKTAEEAHLLYVEAARSAHGEFARTA